MKKKLQNFSVRLIGLFLLLPAVLYAETATELKNNIVSIAVGDLNADQLNDAAVLLKTGDDVDLHIYLANKDGQWELSLSKQAVAWSGALAGTFPHLEYRAKNNALVIYSANDAIGRGRWQQQLTVAYRDNEFLVTGYTYNAHDTLEPNADLNCDVNLLTGDGFKNEQPFKINAAKIKLSDWTDQNIPADCRH